MGVPAGFPVRRLEPGLDPLHGPGEIARSLHFARSRAGREGGIDDSPARAMDSGPAFEGVDANPAVVRQSDESEGQRPGAPSNPHGDEVVPISSGSGRSALRPRRSRSVGPEQFGDLAHLAFIVAGDDQPARPEPPHLRVALSCAVKISAQPIRARRAAGADPFLVIAFAFRGHLSLHDVASEVRTKLPSVPRSNPRIIEVEHRASAVESALITAATFCRIGSDSIASRRACRPRRSEAPPRRRKWRRWGSASAWMTSQSRMIAARLSVSRSTPLEASGPYSPLYLLGRPDCLRPPPRGARAYGGTRHIPYRR